MTSHGRDRLVVIGGVAAGMSAASRAKRRNPDLEVVVIERGPYISYGACGIPYYLAGLIPHLDDLIAFSPERAYRERHIQVWTEYEAVQILPAQRKVVVTERGSGREKSVSYDRLVLATGGRPIHPSLPGIDLEGVFSVRNLQDAARIQQYLKERSPRHALIVGAGYVGLEMAEAFRTRGLEVTVVDKEPHVLPLLDPDVAERIEEELTAHGVRFIGNAELVSLEGTGTKEIFGAVRVKGRRDPLAADLALVAIGVRPEVELAQESGIRLGPTGAIAVTPKMETSVPTIYAVGDCAETRHLVSNRMVYVPLGTTANKQGRVAGENAAGGYGVFKGIVGTSVVKVFDLEVARTGLNTREAEETGFAAVTSTITAPSRAGYYPGGGPITVKLIMDRWSKRLLGAQMVGKEGVSKRIDVFACALHSGMTVEDVSRLDLSYAPPYAPVWDPVLVAANVGGKELRSAW